MSFIDNFNPMINYEFIVRSFFLGEKKPALNAGFLDTSY